MSLYEWLFLMPGHYENECGCWADWGQDHINGKICLKHTSLSNKKNADDNHQSYGTK